MRRSQAPSQLAKRLKTGASSHCPPLVTSNKVNRRASNANPEESATEESSSSSQHEQSIQAILSRPFKVPITGYKSNAFGRSLGIRRAMGKRALHDPDQENALVLYWPEPMKADVKIDKVNCCPQLISNVNQHEK